MVIEKACTTPEDGYTNWSQERIAKEIGISQSAVFQILQQADLKPHKIVYWRGNPRRQTATYKRNGTVSLIAALAVHSGEVTADTIESNNAVNFLKFLKKLDRKYRNKQLHIIVDNLAVHKHKDVKEWIEGKKNPSPLYSDIYFMAESDRDLV